MDDFEWDAAKAAANEAKHGVTFPFAARVFLDLDCLTADSSREVDGEVRQKAIGMIGGRLFTVVFTMRRQTCRIVSARRANSKERRAYADRTL